MTRLLTAFVFLAALALALGQMPLPDPTVARTAGLRPAARPKTPKLASPKDALGQMPLPDATVARTAGLRPAARPKIPKLASPKDAANATGKAMAILVPLTTTLYWRLPIGESNSVVCYGPQSGIYTNAGLRVAASGTNATIPLSPTNTFYAEVFAYSNGVPSFYSLELRNPRPTNIVRRISGFQLSAASPRGPWTKAVATSVQWTNSPPGTMGFYASTNRLPPAFTNWLQ